MMVNKHRSGHHHRNERQKSNLKIGQYHLDQSSFIVVVRVFLGANTVLEKPLSRSATFCTLYNTSRLVMLSLSRSPLAPQKMWGI
jgi:hypothetical protein